ncbi:hypothetical protein BJY52DRAFT_1229684 [Lactarius psammicola]|nr:hypothetical protein BJY52DRAFT_1229684 [Lactarius psammicola]
MNASSEQAVTNRSRAVTTRNAGGGWWRDDGAMAGDRHGAWRHRRTVGNMSGAVTGCDDGGRRWWERHGVTQADKSKIARVHQEAFDIIPKMGEPRLSEKPRGIGERGGMWILSRGREGSITGASEVFEAKPMRLRLREKTRGTGAKRREAFEAIPARPKLRERTRGPGGEEGYAIGGVGGSTSRKRDARGEASLTSPGPRASEAFEAIPMRPRLREKTRETGGEEEGYAIGGTVTETMAFVCANVDIEPWP